MPRSIRTRTARPRRRAYHPRLDALERRGLLSTFTVKNTDDSGPGSFRAAILASNADSSTTDPHTITFAVDGPGVHTIRPVGVGGSLPVATHAVVIDGWSQGGPGYAGSPLIELDGSLGGTYGLVLAAANCTVQGLAINRFVTWNASEAYGIYSVGADAVIQGCYIGTDPTGTQARPNTNGLFVSGTGSRVGSDGDGQNDARERNLISGNRDPGHLAPGANIGIQAFGTGIVIAGNYIGTDVTGTKSLGNDLGVQIGGPSRLGFDGKAAHPEAQRNVISGNTSFGVKAFDHAVVAGNYIGLRNDGASTFGSDGLPVGNGLVGILVYANALVGTDADGRHDEDERNVISGNVNVNVAFLDAGSVVAGNYIGPDKDGTGTDQGAGGSSTIGVFFESGSHDNWLGTDGKKGSHNQAERNIISGNGINVTFHHSNAWNNAVAGNYIGLDKDGANVLAGDGGVYVRGSNNRIGTNSDGNGDADERNVISGVNLQIDVFGPGTAVAGNYIGTDASGTRSLSNVGTALYIHDDAAGTRINNNLISGNTGAGVTLLRAARVEILGNLIGVAKDGTSELGNDFGIRAIDSTDIRIEDNVIAFNSRNYYRTGVTVEGTSRGVSIRRNSIHDNGNLGIDLGLDGVTQNDPLDTDLGPNGLQNTPVLTTLRGGRTTRVAGSLDSTRNTTFFVDLYASAGADPSGYGEGGRYLGSVQVTTDGNGHASFDVPLAIETRLGEWVTATATGPEGTSEFSRAEVITTVVQPVQIDVSQDSVNLEQQGRIAVAILTTADFNAAWVKVSTVRFAGAAAVQSAFGDVDGDGDLDLVLHFRVQDTALRSVYERLLLDDEDADGVLDSSRQVAQVALTGETVDNIFIEGTDRVNLFLAGKKLRELLASLFG